MIQKLVPVAAAAYVAVHGQSTLGKRLSELMDQARMAVATYNMSSVLHSVQAHSIDQANMTIPEDTATYIRSLVQSRRGDPAHDPWGSYYRLYRAGNLVFMISAGPDKKFETADDVKKSIELML